MLDKLKCSLYFMQRIWIKIVRINKYQENILRRITVLGISKACEYAILILEYFSTKSEEEICSKSEIVKSLILPEDYISKVLQNLVKAGIINSVKGVKGGYQLNMLAGRITFLEVIEAIDGKIKLLDGKRGKLKDQKRKKLYETMGRKMKAVESGISEVLQSINFDKSLKVSADSVD